MRGRVGGCVHACMYVCVWGGACVCEYVCAWVWVCACMRGSVRVWACACVGARMCGCLRMRLCLSLPVSVSVCVSLCVPVWGRAGMATLIYLVIRWALERSSSPSIAGFVTDVGACVGVGVWGVYAPNSHKGAALG